MYLASPPYNFPERHVSKAGQLADQAGQPFDKTCDGILTKVLQGGLIALLGDRGTGKTQAAVEVVGRFLSHWRPPAEDSNGWRPHPTRYFVAGDLFLDLRTAMQAGSERDTLKAVKTVGLLVIDEVQERGQTEYEDRVLVNIIDARYGNYRPTILIGNLKPDEFVRQLGPSIASRMTEGASGVVMFTGPSHRRPS